MTYRENMKPREVSYLMNWKCAFGSSAILGALAVFSSMVFGYCSKPEPDGYYVSEHHLRGMEVACQMGGTRACVTLCALRGGRVNGAYCSEFERSEQERAFLERWEAGAEND